MFKVTAHVFSNNPRNPRGDTRAVGKLTFVSHDRDAAAHFADGENFALPPDCSASIDFETAIGLGRKLVWVDCDPHNLELVADRLAALARELRAPVTKVRAV